MRDLDSNVVLAQATRFFPAGTTPRKLKRWITHGCRGVRLAGTKVGDRWYTSPRAAEQFMAQCTRASVGQVVAQPTHKPHQDALHVLKERYGLNV